MSAPPPSPRRAFGAATVQAQKTGGLLRVLTVVVVVVVLGGGAWLGYQWWLSQGRQRDQVYEPEHPVNLDAIDLEAVHHELWGRWALRLEYGYRMHNAEARIAAAAEDMTAALAADGNLTALFEEIEALASEGKLRNKQKRERLLWLTRAWNQYLAAADKPFFLKAFVALDPNPEFHLYAYEVVGEISGTLDGDAEPVRLISRIDEVNRAEWFHGSTPSEGPVVRVDGTVQFALDDVWPLFGPPQAAASRSKLFRDAVIAEAKAHLSEPEIAVLTATADARGEAVRAHRAITDRRGCSGYAIGRLPWDGFDGDMLDKLSKRVMSGRCPPVYPSEFKALDRSRTVLAETEELEPALQSLVGWLVASQAIHELRHVDAGIDIYDEGRPAKCSFCAADDPNIMRAEIAALVAEWAWSDSPAASLYRVCHEDESLAYGSLAAALKGIDWSCAQGPHDDLSAVARALETSSLDSDRPIEVSAAPNKPFELDRAVVRMREAQ